MAVARPLGCELYESFLKERLHQEIPPCQDANPNKASNGSLVRVAKCRPLKAFHTRQLAGLVSVIDMWTPVQV